MAHLYTPSTILPLADGNELMLQQVRHELASVLLRSETPSAALVELVTEAGVLFQLDQCVLLVLSRHQEVEQCVVWSPAQEVVVTQDGTPWQALINHAQVQHQAEDDPPISVCGDGQTVAEVAHATPSRKRRSSSKAATSSNAPTDALQSPLRLVTRTFFQGNSNGVVIFTRSQPQAWTELEVQMLKTFSQSVAIAISQAQLERYVQQQVRYQALIDQLSHAVRGSSDLPQIFQLGVEGTASLLNISRGMVLVMKYADPRFRTREARLGQANSTARVMLEYEWTSDPRWSALVANSTGAIASAVSHSAQLSFSITECELCQALLAEPSQPIGIDSLDKHHQRPSSPTFRSADLFNPAQWPALLMLPIEHQGSVLGCLVFQHSQPRAWTPEEIVFTKLVAAQLGTAMIQTRALRQVHSLVDERTAQLQRSLEVQAKLYEKTRQQVDQLRRMNQVMEEFLSTVSHELLTPLTSMKLAIRMLREANLSPEQRDRYLSILEQQCAQETRLINDLLALQKLETRADPAQQHQIDLRFFVRDLQQLMAEQLAERELTLELDLPERSLPMRTDADSLNRILVELLTNAKKYSNAGSQILLKVSLNHEAINPQVVIAISNTGAPITPEEIPFVFEKFRRGNGATQQAIPGIGLGLALVKGLVAHIGGTISVTSVPCPDSDAWLTQFTLTLPQVANLLKESLA
ncbi:MAG TPA: GAF domain-containing protein [Synechococcales cyanobacterium M55_K2018_004]|nr:GAF domain-containing protein [Synechococcales cyanobacterium M55_K2018_004]